jgi:hypothetical protein
MLLFLLMGSTTLAQFPPGEVANLRIQGDTLSWDVQPDATSYNLYRGDLSSLSATDYGTCRAPGLPTTSFPDPDLPGILRTWFSTRMAEARRETSLTDAQADRLVECARRLIADLSTAGPTGGIRRR